VVSGFFKLNFAKGHEHDSSRTAINAVYIDSRKAPGFIFRADYLAAYEVVDIVL